MYERRYDYEASKGLLPGLADDRARTNKGSAAHHCLTLSDEGGRRAEVYVPPFVKGSVVKGTAGKGPSRTAFVRLPVHDLAMVTFVSSFTIQYLQYLQLQYCGYVSYNCRYCILRYSTVSVLPDRVPPDSMIQ